jgi:hypothetical protein
MNNNDSDTLNARKPDLPGEELFVHVHRYIGTNDNGTGTISAVMDPSSTDFVNPDPPSTDNITQEESISMSYSMNGSNLSNGSSPDANDDLNSPDSATGNTPDDDDHLLLSRKYRTHKDMMKYVNQYAAAKGFIPLHRGKGFFEPDKYKQYSPHESHHPLSLGSIDTKTTSNKQPRRGYIECSSKSPGHNKDVACCFQAYYRSDRGLSTS